MLKLKECNIYDAEFSRIKYGYRLTGNSLEFLYQISLRKCVSDCTHHIECRSVNYHRENSTCEFLGVAVNSFVQDVDNLLKAPGWNHFETNDKNVVCI